MQGRTVATVCQTEAPMHLEQQMLPLKLKASATIATQPGQLVLLISWRRMGDAFHSLCRAKGEN